MFDWKKPTVQCLGRFQGAHDGHIMLFEKALEKTGQICIMIRDVQGVGDNPFEFENVKNQIINKMSKKGFVYGEKYVIMLVPNIVDISYGRGVGYTFTEIVLPEEIQQISATEVRQQMREAGELT